MPAQVMTEQTLQGMHMLQRETNSTSSDPKSVDDIYNVGVCMYVLARLDGKVAIVTGGARGIGEATVKLFAKHGATVIIADLDDTSGSSLAASLSPSVIFAHCDVSSEADVESLVNSAVSRHGRLDILLNNAGLLGDQSKRKSIVDFDADEFDRVMRVNACGTALGIKHAARVMITRGRGCIISTASVAGVMGGMGPHAYAASKHAIVGLTKNAACELGRHGIRVNCISPSGAATSMLVNAWRDNDGDGERGAGQLEVQPREEEEVEQMEELVRGLANLKGVTLRAKDLAEAALYLASDESKSVNGHKYIVVLGSFFKKIFIGV